jgi:flagellar motor protein MotB
MTPPMQHPDAPIVPPAPPFVEGNLPFHNLGEDDVEDTHVEAAAPAPAPVAEAPVVAPPVEAVASVAPTPEPPASSFSDILTSLKAQGNADLEQKGDRLTTIEINSAAFFGSGSATLSSDGAMILRKVADNLKSGAYKDYLITVEGHTDDTPIHTAQFPSNWELSTGRASAVVRFFMEQGISSQQLRAAGYADTFPKLPNRTASGDAIPANQATNRRVVIKLEKIEKI